MSVTQTKSGLFGRLGNALRRTRGALAGAIGDLFARGRRVDEDLLEEVETVLLGADVGVEASERLLAGLRERLRKGRLADADAVFAALHEDMVAILRGVERPFRIPPDAPRPYAILVVGVNGTGKTTTIGKIARRLQREGRSLVLAAGDTFRAAAVEQLRAWGERLGVPVVAQHTGADSASVIYDAVEAARARALDVVIADTAGRLHTQGNLMEELRKVRRVMGKTGTGAPHETLLVLDAGTGQNAIAQADSFGEAVDVSGIVLTKLDGTAKGGVIFALAARTGLPIRFVGVGESAEDLRDFDAEEFVSALLAR